MIPVQYLIPTDNRETYEPLANGNSYVFRHQNGVAASPVPDGDVDMLLRMKRGCCGSPRVDKYRLATEEEVEQWNNGT